jgi:hypothetical protein
MSTRIEDVMIELSKDPYLAMQFAENPAMVSGLTDDEMGIVIRGDRQDLDRTLHMTKSKNDIQKTVKKPTKKTK